MKYFRNLKIAKKMIILCLSIFLIPLCICYTLTIKIVTSALDRHTMDFAEAFNSQIVASLNHFIQDYEAMSVSVLVDNELFSYSDKENRTTTELVSDYENMRKVLFRLSMLQPDLKTASILMKNGDFVQTGSANVRIVEDDLLAEEWVKEIPEHNGYFYLIPAHKTNYWNQKTNEVTITFVRKILSSGVRYLGALLIEVNPSAVINLNDEFETAKNKYGMEISIYDSSGNVIYDTRAFDNNAQTDSFYQFMEFGKEYTVLTGESEKLGLHVLTAIPKASVLLDQRNVHTMMVLLAFICSTLIVVLVILMSHSITKPFAELEYGMSRMKNGEYITINDYPYSDELGDLIRSYNHMIREMQYLIDRVYTSEIRQKDSEIIALQSQINPHMLFNTLESIRMKALLNGDFEVSKMISILARMFRTILDSMNNKNHVIKDELKYAEEYIELQNLREEGRFTFSCDVDENLLNLKCIPILFQPLVENCIEHGQRNSEGKLNIRITGRCQDGKAIFTVQDDGQGMNTDNLQKILEHLQTVRANPNLLQATRKTNCKTIGMANILMRLRLNDDQYGDVRIIYSNDQGTCIELYMNASNRDPERSYQDTGK